MRTRRHPLSRKAAVAAASAVLALLLALGCSRERAPSGGQASATHAAPQAGKIYLDFAGGPTGGTFNIFAAKIAAIATQANDYIDVASKGTGGSAENLRLLDSGEVDLGIVYAGDAWLGRRGRLAEDDAPHTGVRALCTLYGASAHLVVRSDSGLTDPAELAGRLVAVGNPGSGAALAAERFFSALGLWDVIDHRNLGYSRAAADFADDKLAAFWVLAGPPNNSIIEAASRVPVSLLDLDLPAKAYGLYDEHPYYASAVIPSGTYRGQDVDVMTFQDAALLCADAGVDEAAVYDTLTALYSERGVQELRGAHPSARAMGLRSGLDGVCIPLHPGAVRFWEEHGVAVAAELK
ncbi:MAG: TAXI family TRAP transporter solute-binding subunit [Desulfovibrionaceae bacterium]